MLYLSERNVWKIPVTKIQEISTDMPSSMLAEILDMSIRRNVKKFEEHYMFIFSPKGKKKLLFIKSLLLDG